MFEGQKDNTALWSECRFIDPAFTKAFTRRGGFSGRSINATYIIMRATEVLGPVGIGWGWNIIDDRYVDGHEILSSDGAVLGHEIVHVVRIKLWYMWNEQRGEIEHFGQTMFVEKTSSGLKTDEEHAKKSLTDAITKALSCLGIAAEIHLGKWDDNKYVSEMQVEAKERAAPANGGRQSEPTPRPSTIVPLHAEPAPAAPATPHPATGETTLAIEAVKEDIGKQTTYDGIKKAVSVGYVLAREYGNEKLHEEFKALATERWNKVRADATGAQR